MHWFWRATFVLVGILVAAIISFFIQRYCGYPIVRLAAWWGPFCESIGLFDLPGFYMITVKIINSGPFCLIAMTAYWCLSRCFRRKPLIDPETRCRKCSYILRGISEPR